VRSRGQSPWSRRRSAGAVSAAAAFDAATAQRKAIVALGDIVRKQSMIMAYADTFAVLGVLLLLAAGLLLFTRRGQASGAVAHWAAERVIATPPTIARSQNPRIGSW